MDRIVMGNSGRGAIGLAGGAPRVAIYKEGQGGRVRNFPQGQELFHSFAPVIHRKREAKA